MSKFLATITAVGANLFLVEQVARPTDPGFGGGIGAGGDPDYGIPDFGSGRPDQGLPGYGHPDQGLPGRPNRPGNALPIAPVRPSPPIVLPPITTWPPQLPPGIDNSLPPEFNRPGHPIVIPPDPSIGIDQPIYLPTLPPGTALIIALPVATPKDGQPPNTRPALLVQPGTRPVLVYVSAAPQPK